MLNQREQGALSLLGDRASQNWLLAKQPDSGSSARASSSLSRSAIFSVAMLLAILLLEILGVNPDRPAAILFPTDISEERAFAAVIDAGGLPIRSLRSAIGGGVVWIAASEDRDFSSKVRRNGALFAMNPFALPGCLLVDSP